MTSSPVKGWCPTVFEPMAASDGLLVTLKPRVRGWSPEELRLIAAQARKQGSGALLLTQRANLQVRGVSADGLTSFAQALAEAGLLSASADAERRRNILIDPTLPPTFDASALELERALDAESSLAPLPAKFSFAWVPEGGDARNADAVIHVHDKEFWVVPGDAPIGVVTEAPITAAMALAHAFVRLSASQKPMPRRMQGLIAAVGAETVLREAGSSAVRFERQLNPARVAGAGAMAHRRFALAVPFGRLDTQQLGVLADLAERYSTGRVRLTADRAFLLSDTRDREALASAAEAAGFIVDPIDPRLRVAVCSGGAGCAHSTIDMPALAERLAPLWRGEGVLHLSGCAKGCAHPRSAMLTCVARSPEQAFDILCDARADGRASLQLPRDELPGWLVARFTGHALS